MAEWEDIPDDDGWEDIPSNEIDDFPEIDPLGEALDIAGNQAMNVADGLTAGFRDEGEALVSGLYDDRPYNERLDAIENRREQANIGNEWELPAKVAGAAFTGAVTGKYVNPTSLVGGGSLATAEGGIYGLGNSEGSLRGNTEDFLQAAEDTGIGSLFGLVGAMGSAAAGSLANQVAHNAQKAMRPMASRISGWIKGNGAQIRKTTHQRMLAAADDLDIPLTAPERLGNDKLLAKQRRYESDYTLRNAVDPTLDARQARINQIARQQIGLEPADDINRMDLGEAAKGIRAKFKSVEDQFQPVYLDKQLRKELDNIVNNDALGVVKSPVKLEKAITRLKEGLINGVDGKTYLNTRSSMNRAIQTIYKQPSPDIAMAEGYAEAVNVLDKKFASQLSGEAQDTWNLARKQWKNLKLLDQPNAVLGENVNINKVKTGLNRNKGFLRGMDDTPLAKLADINDSSKVNFGNSGTAQRSENPMSWARKQVEMPLANATINRGGLLGPPIDNNISGPLASMMGAQSENTREIIEPQILDLLEGME